MQMEVFCYINYRYVYKNGTACGILGYRYCTKSLSNISGMLFTIYVFKHMQNKMCAETTCIFRIALMATENVFCDRGNAC